MWTLSCLLQTAVAAEPITGARFDALAAGAVDVMRLHQWTLKAQMDRGEVESVYEASLHSMKADFVDEDGAVIRSDLARLLGTYWFGAGDPREGQAWFTGLQVDGAIIGSGSLGSLPYSGELLVFGGYARRGWQGSVGFRGDHHQGVNADGTFVQGLSVASGAADDTDGGSAGVILSVQQAEGAAFGAVLDSHGLSLTGDRDDVLTALRALLQPEAAMDRANLRGVGVPSVAIERIGAGIDPWSEHDDRRDAPAVVQLPLGLDDVGRLGLRARVVPELLPSPGLRQAEAAFTWIGGPLAFGGRVGAWRSRGEWSASAQGYVSLVASHQDDGDEGLALSLSAAHNVPDATTFFAIPEATVFGLSVTYGPLDMTRGAIPVLASQTRHGR